MKVSESIQITKQNTPLDIREVIQTIGDTDTIQFPYIGMVFYVVDANKYYKVTSLKDGYQGSDGICHVDKQQITDRIITNCLINGFEDYITTGGTGNVDLTGYVREEDLADYSKTDHAHPDYAIAWHDHSGVYSPEYHVHHEYVKGTEFNGKVEEVVFGRYADKDHIHTEYMTEDEVLNIVQNNTPSIDTSNLVTKEELNNIDTYNFFTITHEHDRFSVDAVVQNVRNTWFEFIHTSITNNNGHLNYLHFNPKMIVRVDFEGDNELDNNYAHIYLTYDTPDTFNIYRLLNKSNKYSITQPTGEEGVDWDVVSCEYPPLSNVDFESLGDIPDLSTSDIIITPGLKNYWSYSGYCNEFVTIKKVDTSNYAKIYRCTQDEYVAITNKDPNTLYIIT